MSLPVVRPDAEPRHSDLPSPSSPPAEEAGTERERLLAAERAAREAAEAARLEAETANRAKSEFLAVMSHEIRTPINAIRGYAQLLELGIGGPLTPQQADYLARLNASADHLLGIVSDVLDLSQIDAGRIVVSPEKGNTGSVVAAALNLTRPLATARGIHVVDESEIDNGVPYVGDEHRVRQILVNLVTNAIKFTAPGGSVTVSCGTAYVDAPLPPPMAFVRVRDTGIGIAADQLTRIFEPFHQVPESSSTVYTRRQHGTGLGLSISRRLARLMNGELTVESTLAAGATFTLWLPAPSDSAPPVDAVESPSLLQEALSASRTVSILPESPTSIRGAVPLAEQGLGELGDALRNSLDAVLTAYVDRIRRDPAIPGARHLTRLQIEDHSASLISDLAQTLVVVAQSGADAAALLRDGSAIQRTIAEHHGARRRTQGWTEDALRRDHAIMREELERVLRARVKADHPPASGDREPGAASTDESGEAHAALEPALAVLASLVRRAESISVRAWQQAESE